MKEEPLCFNCNHPESDHPLVVLTQGITSSHAVLSDGMIMVSGEKIRIQLSGRSWLYERFCTEFVGQKQLTLF